MPEARGQFVASVAENIPLCREHYQLNLDVAAFPPSRAGQFVQILCQGCEEAGEPPADGLPWSDERPAVLSDPDTREALAVLRRPFSLAGRRDLKPGVARIEIIHRVVGIGTGWLAGLKAGDSVGLLGPLGNRFVDPHAGQIAILVGGGVGIPPMLYLASELAGRGRAIAFCGATTRDLLPLTVTNDALPPSEPVSVDPLYNIAEFAVHGIPAVISTDDGSYGFRGYVTQSLETYLDKYAIRGEMAVIYTCGPEAMMKRVSDIAIARSIPCQIAVERAMACGMGTCQSCCIRVKKPDPTMAPLPGSEWCYRLACTDGPVFKATELLW